MSPSIGERVVDPGVLSGCECLIAYSRDLDEAVLWVLGSWKLKQAINSDRSLWTELPARL